MKKLSSDDLQLALRAYYAKIGRTKYPAIERYSWGELYKACRLFNLIQIES